MSTKQKRKQENTKRKQQPAHFLQKNEEPLQIQREKIDLTPDRLQIIERSTLWYYLRNIESFQLTQDYEIPLPFLIMNWEEVFVEELSSAMCALANEEQGGFILIAAKHNGLTIQQGLENFFKEDKQKIQEFVKKAMKPIVPQQNIYVKVEGLSLYPDFSAALKQEKSEEFVIKISVSRSPGSNKMFYIEHKLPNLRPVYEFFRINISTFGSQTLFSAQKTTETEIYGLIRYAAKDKSGPKTQIRKKTQMDSNFALDLRRYTMKIGLIPEASYQRLAYFLNAFRILRHEIQASFPKIKSSEIVFQLQITDNSKTLLVLKNVQKFLQKSKINYRLIQPFSQFQNDLSKFKKDQSVSYNYICYLLLAVEESNQNFSAEIKKTIKDIYKQKLVVDEVKGKLAVGTHIDKEELNSLLNFLLNYFKCIPVIITQECNETLFKSVQFRFRNDDLNAAAFSYFCFSLAKKRFY